MIASIGFILICAGIGCIATAVIRYGWRLTVLDLTGSVLNLAGNVLRHGWILAALWAAVTIIDALGLWRRRRKRKRAARALGEKSRSLIAGLVARGREAAKPRPVFRPQRGGAS